MLIDFFQERRQAARELWADDLARDMMGVTERHLQGAHQPIGEIGRGGVTRSCGLFHRRRVGLHITHHPRHSCDAE